MKALYDGEAPDILKKVIEDISDEVENYIANEAKTTFELSDVIQNEQEREELFDEWKSASDVLWRMAVFQAKAMEQTKDYSEDNMTSLKDLVTQATFFSKLVNYYKEAKPIIERIAESKSLDKLEGETEEQHLERLKKYIKAKENNDEVQSV